MKIFCVETNYSLGSALGAFASEPPQYSVCFSCQVTSNQLNTINAIIKNILLSIIDASIRDHAHILCRGTVIQQYSVYLTDISNIIKPSKRAEGLKSSATTRTAFLLLAFIELQLFTSPEFSRVWVVYSIGQTSKH